MSKLNQERPETSSPKQKRRTRLGTSDKARGHREAGKQAQRHARQAPSRSLPQPEQSKEVVTLPVARQTRERSSLEVFFFESFSLVKGFTLFGFMVAAMHVIVFGLDLAIAWPLQRVSSLFDMICVGSGLALACLSWGTFRDQVRAS